MTRSAITKFFSQALGGLVSFAASLNALATIWTFILVLFVTADVLGRFLLNRPIAGTPEILKASLVGLAFLYLPHTTLVGRQIRSDLLKSYFGPRFKMTMEVITALVGSAVFTVILFSSWNDMVTAWRIGEWEGEGALRVPMAPFRTILILGAALTAIIYAVRCYKSIRIINGGKKEE